MRPCRGVKPVGVSETARLLQALGTCRSMRDELGTTNCVKRIAAPVYCQTDQSLGVIAGARPMVDRECQPARMARADCNEYDIFRKSL